MDEREEGYVTESLCRKVAAFPVTQNGRASAKECGKADRGKESLYNSAAMRRD